MKNFIVIFIVAALSSVIIGCAGPSSATLGDKSAGGVLEARKALVEQVEYYQSRIFDLQEENNQLSYSFQDYAAIQVRINDSLVADYRKKINRLEGLTEEILARGLGKDKVSSVTLTGYDPREVADAYATVKYMDEMGCAANASSSHAVKKDSCGLRAILENTRYQTVIAKVTGPVGFYREFKINPRGFSPVFMLPMPGSYTTTFINCNNESDYAAVTKVTGPNIRYYTENGEAYDYKATAILR
jgi:hypothetical protein